MDLYGVVINNEGRLKVGALKSRQDRCVRNHNAPVPVPKRSVMIHNAPLCKHKLLSCLLYTFG
jgi:hypothetical protein